MSVFQAQTGASLTDFAPATHASGIGLRMHTFYRAAKETVADVEAHEIIEGATLLGLSGAASVLLMAALGW